MELTISYLLKSVMVLLALYLFYYTLLRKENNFAFNRLYLLLAPLVALSLPLLKWPVALAPDNAIGEALQAIQLNEVIVTAYGTPKASSETSSNTLAIVAAIIYGAGTLVILLRLVKQLWQVQKVKARAAVADTQLVGAKVYQLPEHTPTFAFGNNIFLSKQAHLSKTDQDQVLAHELAHVKLRHTWDVLYYELISAILWLNPVVWLLKQELRDVHEYQADAEVVTSYQAQTYTSLLSKEALLNMGLPIGSYFQKPQVLKRLQMLKQHKHKPGWLRPLLVLPLIAGLTAVFSVQQVDAQASIFKEITREVSSLTNSPSETEKQAEVKSTPAPRPEPASPPADQPVAMLEKPATEEPVAEEKAEEERPYTYVEQMPYFEGGDTELMRYFAKNVRYPKTTQEAGISGLVVVSFTVEKDGSLRDVQIVKSLDDDSDAEALRVVESMNGSWQPGKQNGKAVRVRYTLPVRFQIK
ncbi:M56 family metallopeptidase [uncultured Pontibacter sp.]|uniref:M56 family metallopeptidase n=1 Tax=uncultured Pontibacter sp. TaxID=453356 RepID=UPI00261F43F1|nr:M56 family metallopeptidase [uncultured Pontibacter sp.]